MSNYSSKSVDGDLAVRNDVTVGRNINVRAQMKVGRDLVVGGALVSKYVNSANMGLYRDESTLKLNQPSPKVGQYAGVGSTMPATLYVCQSAGTWTATLGEYKNEVTASEWQNIYDTYFKPEVDTKIETGNVQTSDIVDAAVTTAKLADGAVTAEKLANGIIETLNIADESVTTEKIADGAITASKMADGAIANSSITNAKIADGAVTTSKMSTDLVALIKAGTGLSDDLIQSIEKVTGQISDIETQVNPLTATFASSNAGTYEVGTSVTPVFKLNILRKGSDVASSATVTSKPTATVSADHKTVTGAATTSAVSYTITVTQGGQTVSLAAQSFAYTNYRYRGTVDAIPSNYKTAIKALATKELSTSGTLSAINLAAGKYYLFAVKGTVTLICRDNATNGVIDGCVTGTVADLPQENDSSKTNLYSYILVPASSSAWTFKITNS